jgi:PEP-CTERM motif
VGLSYTSSIRVRQFTKLDNFLAAVELLEKPQFFGYLFDSPMTGALPIVGEPLLIGQPPGPGGQPVGQTLSVFALDNLALQTIPEPATLLTFGAAASFLLGFRRRAR